MAKKKSNKKTKKGRGRGRWYLLGTALAVGLVAWFVTRSEGAAV